VSEGGDRPVSASEASTASVGEGRTTDRLGIALVFVSAVGFGTLGIFGIYAQRVGLSIPTVLTYRFLVSAVIVWAVLAFSGRFRPLRGRTLAIALALGALGYATMSGLYFVGLEFMTAGMVGIVLYTYPALVVVLAAATLDERITRRTAVALVSALGGIALVIGADPAGASPTGVVIVLGAAGAYAAYIVTSRAVLETVDPLVLTAYVLPAGGATFVAISMLTGGVVVPTTFDAWGVLIGVATIATAVPVLAFFAGVERIGASRAGIVSTAEPVVTVILGAALFAEPVTVATVGGGACVLLAVVLLR